MPTAVDAIFAFTILVASSLVEHYYFWPRFRAQVAAGDPQARPRAYRRLIGFQWLLAAVTVAIWASYDRAPALLRLAPPSGWRLAVAVLIVLLVIAFIVLQLVSVGRLSPERRVAVRPKLGSVAFMLPRTGAEYRGFLALSATAGVCEELLFRGYLVWFLTPWLGTTTSFVFVVAAFGIAHSYQGAKGAVRATLAGAVMAAIVIATNWIVPAMIVHALVDAGSGTVGYWLLRDGPSADASARTGNAAPTVEERGNASAAVIALQS